MIGKGSETSSREVVTEILRLLSKMHDECGTNAGQDALWDAHEAVEQLLDAVIAERAQESAGVLTDKRISEIFWSMQDNEGHVEFAREILAANKEK